MITIEEILEKFSKEENKIELRACWAELSELTKTNRLKELNMEWQEYPGDIPAEDMVRGHEAWALLDALSPATVVANDMSDFYGGCLFD